MSEHEAFIQAIREVPDDLTRRLVFADWLEEQGSSQAEYIRLCCELEKRHPKSERSRLETAAAELHRSDHRTWNGRVHRMLAQTSLRRKSRGGGIRSWAYVRGCIEYVVIDVPTLEKNFATVQRIGPITSLAVTRRLPIRGDRFVSMIAGHDGLRCIRRLRLNNVRCPGDMWRDLFTSGALPRLQWLRLGQWSLLNVPFGFGTMSARRRQEPRPRPRSLRAHWLERARALFEIAPDTLNTVEIEACCGPSAGAITVEFRRTARGRVSADVVERHQQHARVT